MFVVVFTAVNSVVELIQQILKEIEGVKQSQIQELSLGGASFDAPFNPAKVNSQEAALTVLIPESARIQVIAGIARYLRTSGPEEIRMRTGTGREVVLNSLSTRADVEGLISLPVSGSSQKRGSYKSDALESRSLKWGVLSDDFDSPEPKDLPEFYFVLEGEKVRGNQAAAPSDFDLVFRYDLPPDDALAIVEGDELERQRTALNGSFYLLLQVEGGLSVRDKAFALAANFENGKMVEPLRFKLRALQPGAGRIRVNFMVNMETVYRLVLDIDLVDHIDAGAPPREPVRIDLDTLNRKRTPRDVKLILNDTGAGWQATFFWDKETGLIPKTITNLNFGQLDTLLNQIKADLEQVATHAIWKNIESDLSLGEGIEVPREMTEYILSAGSLLYSTLRKSDLGDFIEKIESLPDGSKVSIETQTAFIPWELLYPVPYYSDWSADQKAANYAPKRLWGNRFQIEVLLISGKSEAVPPAIQPGPARVSMIVGNTVADGETSAEPVQWQQQYFADRLTARGEYLTQWPEIQQVFSESNHPATFIYFLCHGQGTLSNRGFDSKLEVDKQHYITPRSLTTMNPYLCRPVVFVNSCSVGAISPFAYTSFLENFREKRASGLIASSFPLPTRFAAAFGQKVMDGYLAKKPIGQVLFDLRRLLYDEGNPLGMLYSLQCPLDVRAPHENL